jgi:signal peptidase I
MIRRRTMRWDSIARLRWLLLLPLVALVLRQWVYCPLLISGDSMLPSLRSGQFAVVSKLAYRFHPPARGDVVLVWTGKEQMVKRVVGLPGEEIAACDGVLYVNGSPLNEPYITNRNAWSAAPGKIAADHFVVCGDNRAATLMLLIRKERVIGRLLGAP